MSANIRISILCPGDSGNSGNTYYILKRRTVSVEDGDTYGISTCNEIGTEVADCFIRANISQATPTINSKIYTNAGMTITFNGQNKHWRVAYYSKVYICVIDATGTITDYNACGPTIIV